MLYIAFIIIHTFENGVLCLFILSQKSVRLQQLEVVKPRYNRIERLFWLFTKLRMIFVALILTYVIVMIFVPSTDFYYVLMV